MNMNAKLISENTHGQELRFAARRANTWPGYHESAPLGKRGYWFGNEQYHVYLGRSVTASQRDYYELPRD